jgi:PEP-CTERM motif
MKTKLFFATILLAFASNAFASDIVSIDFTALPNQTAGGYYVGFSTANIIESSTMTLDNFSLMCDDFLDTTDMPSGPFTYDVSTLDTLSNVKFTSPISGNGVSNDTELKNYELAAIILYTYNNLGSSQGSEAGAYNFALWDLFDPSAPSYSGSSTVLDNAITQYNLGATNATNEHAYSELQIFTPTGSAVGNQEFLGLSATPIGTPAVPEPTSLVLLGSGLIAIGLFGRKRKLQ